jgi:hypothetical protein
LQWAGAVLRTNAGNYVHSREALVPGNFDIDTRSVSLRRQAGEIRASLQRRLNVRIDLIFSDVFGKRKSVRQPLN